MFSYFSGGISDIIPQKQIDLASLVKIIKNNPKKADIDYLISEKRNSTLKDGKLHYKELKTKLPYITPNCVVTRRELNNWAENFSYFSQFIYFDVDLKNGNPSELKSNFIKNYGNDVSLVSLSASHGGISILFKVANRLQTEQDFNIVRQKLIEKYFQNEENLDSSVKDVGRAWFIPFDQNVYVNYDAEINLIPDLIDNVNQNINYVNQGKSLGGVKNTSIYTDNPIKILHDNNKKNNNTYLGNIIPYKTLIKDYKFESDIIVKNNIVDYNPVNNYLQIKHQKDIPDGYKHKVYAGIISTFIKLNPSIEFNAVYSLLYHINNSITQKMIIKELYRHTLFIYTIVKENKQTNYLLKNRTKRVHFNKQSNLDKNIKRDIANEINGVHRRNDSIKKIKDAIENLLKNKKKVTKSAVMRESGLSNKTVIKHWNSDQMNIEEYMIKINLEYNFSNSTNNCNDESVFNKVNDICNSDLSNHPLLAC